MTVHGYVGVGSQDFGCRLRRSREVWYNMTRKCEAIVLESRLFGNLRAWKHCFRRKEGWEEMGSNVSSYMAGAHDVRA